MEVIKYKWNLDLRFNLCMKSRLREIPRLAGLKIRLHCRLGILEIFQQGSQQAISPLLKI